MTTEEGAGAATAPSAGGGSAQNAGATPGGETAAGSETQNAGGGSSSEDPRIAEARNEAIAERKSRQELEAKLKELEDAKLSDEQKTARERDELAAKVTELEARIADRDLNDAIVEAATSAKPPAKRPGAVARLIDRSAVKLDGEGKPTNIGELIENARKEAPELFEAGTPNGSADQGARGGQSGEGSMSDRIRSGFGRGA